MSHSVTEELSSEILKDIYINISPYVERKMTKQNLHKIRKRVKVILYNYYDKAADEKTEAFLDELLEKCSKKD